MSKVILCLSRYILSGFMMLTCLIDLDHLVKVVSVKFSYARFFHCMVTIFPFIINKYLGEDSLGL